MTVEQIPQKQVIRVLIGLMSGMFLSALESTIVATAAPTIVEDLGGLNRITWVFTSYMLATTVSAALWGKLSDLLGRRPTYLAAIAIFISGSVLCGFAQSMTQLIVFRGLQGIGGGGLMALSFTIMADILSPRQRGRYIGFISATFAAGSVIGPIVGGVLVDVLSWRWIFLINLPLGLASAGVAYSALKGVGSRREAKLDIFGALTLSVAITSLLLASVWGGSKYPWGSVQIIGLGLGSVVLLTLFVLIEQRVPEPILAIRLLRNPSLMLSVAIGALTTVSFNGAIVYLPLFLQTVDGASVANSGLQLAPLTFTMSLASIITGRRITSTGRYKLLLYVGLVFGIIAAAGMARLDGSSGTVEVIVLMSILGISFGMTAPVVNLCAQNAMPMADLGAASSAMITFRSLGGTIGIASVGTLLFSKLRSGIQDLPGGADLDVEAIASGPETIAALDEPLRSDVIEVMADSISGGLTLALPLVVVGLVIAFFLPELPLRDHTEISVESEAVAG